MNRITCICLGVKDMAKSIEFYQDKLRFKTKEKANNPSAMFFDTHAQNLNYIP